MTDTLSVLLIIGSAVLGPVEAQHVPPDGVTRESRSPTGWSRTVTHSQSALGSHVGSYTAEEPRRETLPELCERAMREVGATAPPMGTAWRNDENGHPKLISAWAHLGETEVRCIPTPRGYKR